MELSQIPAAFHSKLRLAVIAALLSGPKNFRALQDLTGATPGNLGKQLELLEAEGYLRSEKAFVGRRPNTTYTLLPYGREQFAQYVALLESLLAGAQGVLGCFNLLPILPLDGGRMIRCVLLARLPITQAEHISEIVSFAACAVLLLIGVFLTFFRKSGLWPLGTAAYLTVRLLMLARRTDTVQ